MALTAGRLRIPSFWRDVRVLQVLAQAVFLLLVLLGVSWLIGNLRDSLEALGLNLSFGFFNRTAGFIIGEGRPMQPSDSYGQAFLIGLNNSLRVIGLGLILATVLGILSGIALLSPNWLLRNLTQAYVEVMRNTPLLVQLFFLYFGVILRLPPLERRIELGPLVLSQRGVFLPRLLPEPGFAVWAGIAGAALLAALAVGGALARRQRRTGRATRPLLWAGLTLLLPPLLAWLALPAAPLALESPELVGLRMVGGSRLSPEFAGILFGLVIYTAAFIADIVRAGILAIPPGQREAARSIGLSEGQIMRKVILPQAMRVIVPPLTNQYLNLAKNSSLAVGVGFPDLYTVSQTIFNQTGQAVQVISLMMVTYLVMSLAIAAVMNVVNARLKIVER